MTIANTRIDHRSYKRQGKSEQPTIHLGAAASQMEKRGIRTKRGDINRNIKINNREIRELKKQLYQIDKWLKEQEENAEPTLAETINNVMQKRQTGTHKPAFSELAKAANLINFIKKNDIDSYENLHYKVDEMHERLYTVRQALKLTESRLKELNENLQQAVHYKQNKAVYEQYNSIQIGRIDKLLKRDPKANFYEANRARIALFQSAERHLKKYLKAEALSVKAWKSEVAELTAKKDGLYKDYYKLKDDVKVIDDVKREVDEIVRVDILERVDRLEQRQRRDRGAER